MATQKVLLSEPGAREGPVASIITTKSLTWTKASADALAADEIVDLIIGYIPLPTGASTLTITAVNYIPAAALVHHASNFLTINVIRVDVAGSTGDTFATVSTDVGDWTKQVPVPLTLNSAFTTWTDDGVRGFAVRLDIVKSASGVVCPAGSLVIEYTVS